MNAYIRLSAYLYKIFAFMRKRLILRSISYPDDSIWQPSLDAQKRRHEMLFKG